MAISVTDCLYPSVLAVINQNVLQPGPVPVYFDLDRMLARSIFEQSFNADVLSFPRWQMLNVIIPKELATKIHHPNIPACAASLHTAGLQCPRADAAQLLGLA